MNFSVVSGRQRGYDPVQVDGLISRARRQYEMPHLDMMTSGVLQAARFSLVQGGYAVAEVDSAIARIAERFEEEEISRALRAGASRQVSRELDDLLVRISRVLQLGFKRAFTAQRWGYDPKLVREIFSRVKVANGRIELIDTLELRSSPLGSKRRGLSRLEVDEFLGFVIAAVQRQRAL
jgi:DivIVA domain-containing protein